MNTNRDLGCLTISATGEKLKPLLIFKGKGKTVRKVINRLNYTIKKNSNAWMTKEIFKEYLLSTVRMHLQYTRMDLNNNEQLGLVVIGNRKDSFSNTSEIVG